MAVDLPLPSRPDWSDFYPNVKEELSLPNDARTAWEKVFRQFVLSMQIMLVIAFCIVLVPVSSFS
jgi:hypothetical protein